MSLMVDMETIKNIYFKMRNIMFYSFVNPAVREEIGIRLVSGITQNQGWFLWMNDSDGVYDLYSLPGEHDNSANYLIKYYPSLDEEVFESYSDKEKKLRKEMLFEAGVPKYGVRESILAEHFIVGYLDVLWEDEAIWLHLTVNEENSEDGKSKVPVTQLSHTFFSRLLRGMCFLTKTAPSIILTKSNLTPTGTVSQFVNILIPNTEDKSSLISEICTTVGVNHNGFVNAAVVGEPWKPLFIEDKDNLMPVPSDFIDEKWWEMSSKGAAVLPEELRL
jgi:hypothetical protein